jgi:hypothetical protein
MPNEQMELMVQFLENRDTPCPRCKYNLRGLKSKNCPECGDEVTLQVGLTEPKLAALITLVVACSIALGASSLISALALFNGAPYRFWNSLSGILILSQLMGTAIMLPLFLYQRHHIRRWQSANQWWLAIAVLGTVAISSIIIIAAFD